LPWSLELEASLTCSSAHECPQWLCMPPATRNNRLQNDFRLSQISDAGSGILQMPKVKEIILFSSRWSNHPVVLVYCA
jgi:hypothetical protein